MEINLLNIGYTYPNGDMIKLGDTVEVAGLESTYICKLELTQEDITGDDYKYVPCMIVNSSDDWKFDHENMIVTNIRLIVEMSREEILSQVSKLTLAINNAEPYEEFDRLIKFLNKNNFSTDFTNNGSYLSFSISSNKFERHDFFKKDTKMISTIDNFIDNIESIVNV